MSGCVPSLHPLYTAEDLTFDANLLGVCGQENGTAWAFAKSGDHSHLLTHTEGEGDSGVGAEWGATGRATASLQGRKATGP
jgi:hypothetical protein